MSNIFNKFKILSCSNNPFDINNININRLLTTKPKKRGSLNQYFNFHFNNKSPSKKNKNYRKSASLTSNNPSTVETSLSNSIFDGTMNIKKSTNFLSKFGKNNAESNQKALIYYVPKNIDNKLIFDIVFGHYYFLSKNKGDIRKIEKFIFEFQQKFNKKLNKLYNKDIYENDNNDNSEISNSLRTKREIFNNNNINKYFEIQDKLYFFYKLEDIMALYSLIIFYLVKIQNKNKAKTIYLLMINQNLKCINYLEKLIDFKVLIEEKNNKNLMRIYQISIRIILKVYSFLMKYGFYLHVSYYGNLFMKKYINLSYNFYLFSLNLHKAKNAPIENETQIKHWFSYLNYFSAYFSIANYLPLKIPISLFNVILSIYDSFDDRHYELKDKNLLLCTLYNRSILLYVNGQSEEAINSFKEVKKKLFLYIEEYTVEEEVVNPIKNSNYSSLLVDKQKKNNSRKKTKKGLPAFKKFVRAINSSKILLKSISANNLSSKKLKSNVNKKFENYFLSNTPFNIMNFINHYLKTYNIKIDNGESNINPKATFSKKNKKNESSSLDRKSFIQLTDVDKNKQKKLPNIFKSPLLIRSELLLGEIEIDRKNYRAAYAYINHALAIISTFRKIKNIFYLSKFRNEQKLIKEFLNIIDNSNIKNETVFSENQELFSDDEEDYNSIDKDEEFEREFELKEKININKKILKEIEKFFVFFATLSAYQIKILNDTQPTSEKRNFLPILFQNQFKDCLTIKQIIALENLHVMSLSRYMILKDPTKLILPANLNINPLYFEKPELFSPRYFRLEKKITFKENKTEKEIIQKKTYEIFLKILQSKNIKIYIQNFLNNNYNLVMKILENSTQNEINKMIENPKILIKPIEQYKKKNANKENKKAKTNFHRHKSQVCLSSNKKTLKKKLSLIDENDIRMTLFDKNNLQKKHLKTSNSEKFHEIVNDNIINRTCTSSKSKFLFSKKNIKSIFDDKNKNNDNKESYSSINISLE